MTLESLQQLIEEKPGVLLYFSGESCNVCHALRPKVKELFEQEFPLVEQVFLNAHEHPEISAHFQVFSVPTLIVYLGGREFAREGRAVSLHALAQKLRRPYTLMTEA
ncbi:thioredoxin family protein [Nitratifractor salsuginis]|uniref:Thioredoxin domain-containing protein n=1 Tax=Nitratifractor salsuginis (strain DSM 16511 / JCM 12458 / E9I37-1) TaxID=749222 RepID=E6WXP0_NITSE|nr:thioredoxin family protein [Nitratifractor salsuginis]ADV46297.1 Thioredoxin domain-containing protein [Nitratifractor salsuginis DSM 16511]